MRSHLRWPTGLVIALLITALFTHAFAHAVAVTYAASDAELVNPYIGNAVWARDTGTHEQPFTLVYADLTLADFEPEEGTFDFASFEEKNQFDRWRAEGKHLILRFVLDLPGEKKHRDIPDWLYEATGRDGTAYSIEYGRGYSPNYENETLIRAHAAAIAALGERYGNDPFVAYVQLGSLGHWGEWHVHADVGAMPPQAVYAQYVLPYIAAFPNACLLMRRPFAIAADYGLGLFNDTAGSLGSTTVWLDWIQNGGDFETTDGTEALVPMTDAWQTAPIGGELAYGSSYTALLGEDFAQTLSLFTQSHTSWIGPASFADITRGSDAQEALNELLRTVGYRLRVSRCEVDTSAGVRVTLFWTNDGIAPFYFDWQPTLAVTASDGTQTLYPLSLALLDILPGTTVTAGLTLPELDPEGETYTLSVGIVDPATGEAGVALAMQAEQEELWYTLLQIETP